MCDLNLTPDPDGIIGNDGLTDAERAELAQRGPHRPSHKGLMQYQAMREGRDQEFCCDAMRKADGFTPAKVRHN
jgi:hypothetical protein